MSAKIPARFVVALEVEGSTDGKSSFVKARLFDGKVETVHTTVANHIRDGVLQPHQLLVSIEAVIEGHAANVEKAAAKKGAADTVAKDEAAYRVAGVSSNG